MKKSVAHCVQWVGVFACVALLLQRFSELTEAPGWLSMLLSLLLGWYYPRIFPIIPKPKK